MKIYSRTSVLVFSLLLSLSNCAPSVAQDPCTMRVVYGILSTFSAGTMVGNLQGLVRLERIARSGRVAQATDFSGIEELRIWQGFRVIAIGLNTWAMYWLVSTFIESFDQCLE